MQVSFLFVIKISFVLQHKHRERENCIIRHRMQLVAENTYFSQILCMQQFSHKHTEKKRGKISTKRKIWWCSIVAIGIWQRLKVCQRQKRKTSENGVWKSEENFVRCTLMHAYVCIYVYACIHNNMYNAMWCDGNFNYNKGMLRAIEF